MEFVLDNSTRPSPRLRPNSNGVVPPLACISGVVVGDVDLSTVLLLPDDDDDDDENEDVSLLSLPVQTTTSPTTNTNVAHCPVTALITGTLLIRI